jgi:hypothetical protein
MAVYFDQNGNLVDTEDNINFFNTGTEQVFPKQGLEPLYPNFGAPMVNDTSLSPDLPYDTLRFVDNNSLSLQPNYLMPNTNKVPQLPANRLEGLPSLNLQSLPANMGVANEEDVEQVDSLTGQKKSGGILDLIMSIAVPGYGFLKNIGSSFKQDPRATGIRNFYSPEGLTSTGSIASGIMKGYNPISGGALNFFTGGKFGQPTQYGLSRAMQKRIENIVGRKAPQTDISRSRVAELRNLQRAEMEDRSNRGESLGSIGRSTFSGPGMAFERQSGGVSGKGTANERNYGGR